MVVLVEIQVLALHGGHLVKYFVQALLGVEDGGLVHVVPEAVDAHIQQTLVLQAEPSPGGGVQHVREMGSPGPDSAHEGGAVLFLAEVALLDALLVDGVALFDLDARVDDGDEVDPLLFHVCCQTGQIREFLIRDREVLVPLHVVDVQVDGVQGDAGLPVSRGHLTHIRLVLVAPAALAVAEGPLRRDVASAYHLSEGADYGGGSARPPPR